MSVIEQKCFAVSCDRCGHLYAEDFGPVHFASPEGAASYLREELWDTDWETDGEAWFCERCADSTGWNCDDCGKWFADAVAHHAGPIWTSCSECFALADVPSASGGKGPI